MRGVNKGFDKRKVLKLYLILNKIGLIHSQHLKLVRIFHLDIRTKFYFN